MLIVTQDRLFKGVEWILFLCLCFVSVFFMREVFEKYISNKSSFIQYGEPITEHPTITICFDSSKEFFFYEIGTDFNITIKNNDLNLGENKFKDTSETIYLEKILTDNYGYCYKITSITNIAKEKTYRFIDVYFNESIPYTVSYTHLTLPTTPYV